MSNQEWKRSNMKQYALRISVSTGIPDAVKKAAEDLGIAETAFVRVAIEEKLQRDGYIQKSGD